MTYMSDKEQAEMVKNFWNDYGRYLAVAIVIGLLLGVGWRWWNDYQVKRKQQASALYGQVLTESLHPSGASGAHNIDALVLQLQSKYKSSPYTSFAKLYQAAQSISGGNLKQAETDFRWVIANAGNKALKQLARLRLARVLIGDNQAKEALQTLSTVDDTGFNVMVKLEKSNAYLALQQNKQASNELASAKTLMNASGISLPSWVFVQ